MPLATAVGLSVLRDGLRVLRRMIGAVLVVLMLVGFAFLMWAAFVIDNEEDRW